MLPPPSLMAIKIRRRAEAWPQTDFLHRRKQRKVKEQLQIDYGPAATLPELFLLLATMFVLVGCGPAGPRAVLKGERLIREQKYSLEVQELQEAIRLIPTNAQPWNHLGLALHHNKQPKEALKA